MELLNFCIRCVQFEYGMGIRTYFFCYFIKKIGSFDTALNEITSKYINLYYKIAKKLVRVLIFKLHASYAEFLVLLHLKFPCKGVKRP